jgi:nucleotide-binding universal stress UspA family protein
LYKNVLVFVDNANACESRTRYAARLAAALGASLEGCYAIPPVSLPVIADAAAPAMLIESQLQAIAADREAAEKQFENGTKDFMGLVELQCIDGDPMNRLLSAARTTDLVVISQYDENDERSASRGFVEHAILDAGAPVLLLPPQSTVTMSEQGLPFANAYIAWSGARESARALRDSIPLLQRLMQDPGPGEVVVETMVGEESEVDAARRELQLVCDYLKSHDIDAHSNAVISSANDPGEGILARAIDLGAELIVMGAYGHSRLREFVLGGATLTILDECAIPTLLSH